MEGRMRQTTTLIKSTIEEKRSFRGALLFGETFLNSWSITVGLRAFSMTALAITDSGESW